MKNLLLSCIGILAGMSLNAQSTGAKSGQAFYTAAIPGADKTWDINDNLYSSDNLYTSFGNLADNPGSHTDYIVITDFGFSLSPGTSIAGIVAEVERSDANGKTADYSVRIVKGGTIGAAERSTGTPYPVTDAYSAYGSNSDMWGQSWSAADINNAGFGIAIAAQRTSAGGVTAGKIDHVRITVYFQNFFTLPVRLTSFTASKKNQATVLKWTTTEETNMSRYEVEHSTDGSVFMNIGSLQSQAASSFNTYSFEHLSPSKGMNYYRLKMIGNTSADLKYSKVTALAFSTESAAIYPTIINSGQPFYFENPLKESLQVDFYTSNGKKITSISGNTDKFPSANLSGASGTLVYIVYDSKKQVKSRGSVIVAN